MSGPVDEVLGTVHPQALAFNKAPSWDGVTPCGACQACLQWRRDLDMAARANALAGGEIIGSRPKCLRVIARERDESRRRDLEAQRA